MVLRITFVVYFERLERFKNIKNKSLQSRYQQLISQMELGPAELGGRRGHWSPPHPLNLGSYRKDKQKQEQTQPITIVLHLQIFLTFHRSFVFQTCNFICWPLGPRKGITKNVKNWSFFLEKSQNLHAVFLLQFKIFLPQGIDTVNHGLNKLNFRVSKTMLVGNVIGVS